VDKLKEEEALKQVTERLSTKFAQVDAAHVEAVVNDTASHFASASVRDFVPVLVERSARDRLREELDRQPLFTAGQPGAAIISA
jgi:hypothetical protein